MSTPSPADDMDLVHLGLLVLCLLGLMVAWHFYHADIAYWTLRWAWHQLQWVEQVFAGDMLQATKQSVLAAARAPDGLTFHQTLALLNETGRYFVALPLLVTFYGLWSAQRHPANRTRRHITAATLPRIMSSHSPAVTPVLYYGDLLNTDPVEQRRALNPEEWVERHGLVVNQQLRREACKALLLMDLGNTISAPDQLSPVERALFAVFGARLLSDGKDIPQAQVLLDALNRSCHHGNWNGQPGYPDLTVCDAAFAKYAAHPASADWIARHPYPRTLLHAMHKEALSTGKLPSAHFRWLKGMDRPLWYALNTTGRKAPFMESSAVFTQCMWEKFAFDNGYRLQSPCLDEAVNGLESYLIKLGIVRPL
ncbi:MAG: conjugal transfer protein TrbA [Burkholderiaceae bacterium]|nr:conjugal transfer protein TrbA [Burkholderiaceae bacterium]